MKKNNIKIFLLLATIYLSSCKKSDSNLLIIETFENGKIYCLSAGKDTLSSDRLYFYETGSFLGVEKYKHGKKHGESHFFYESGRMKDHWIWYEGHPDGYCYNYADNYAGYPMEFMVYGGAGQLVYREKYDSTGKSISKEGVIPKEWRNK